MVDFVVDLGSLVAVRGVLFGAIFRGDGVMAGIDAKRRDGRLAISASKSGENSATSRSIGCTTSLSNVTRRAGDFVVSCFFFMGEFAPDMVPSRPAIEERLLPVLKDSARRAELAVEGAGVAEAVFAVWVVTMAALSTEGVGGDGVMVERYLFWKIF